MTDVCLTSAYLAPIEYYTKLYAGKRVFLECHDHYVKQTYRNRCVIAGPNGALQLTVPIEKPAGEKCCMKDIRISDHGKWRHVHWQAFMSCYFTSPFFEYYQDDFRPFYEKKYEYLYDFNCALQAKVCELLDLQPNLIETTEYKRVLPDGIEDYRDRISPKQAKEKDETFQARPYYQVFQEKWGFLPNLSIIDLLFNMGPEGLLVLDRSIVR